MSELKNLKKNISPCVKICIIHKKYDICLGCYRTTEEITNWINYSQEKKIKTLSELKIRKIKFKPKRRKKT